MFAVGHMALAYLLGKGSAKTFHVSANVPALLVLSIIPDIDILAGIEGFHRGPVHSAIAALLVFIPLFIVYGKKAAPYFVALISHAAIGDLLIGGGIQLFWPVTNAEVSLYPLIPKLEIVSPINAALETALFVIATAVMFKTRDLHSFFQNKTTNLLLAIPVATVLLPTFLAYPLEVPLLLVPSHLFFLAVFVVSVLMVLTGARK